MANTKITASNIADDAITAAHIDSTATGMTFADLTVTGTEPTIKLSDSDGTEQNTTLNQSGGNFFIKARDNTSNAGIVFAGNASGSFDEYARFTSSGFLGIGTSSPFTKLHIKGTGWSSGSPYGAMALIEANNTYDNNWGHLIITDTSTADNNGGSIRFATGTVGALNPFSGIQGVAEGTSYGGLALYTRASGGTAGERVRVRASGRVGINKSDPSSYLHIHAGSQTDYSYTQSCGQGTYYHGYGNSFYFHHFQSGSTNGFYWGSPCVANGGFSSASDERLKENINTIDNALDKVAIMNGITFTWKDTEKRGNSKQFGVTAQNMLEVDSELPVLSADGEATLEEINNPEIETDCYTFDYSRLTPFFIEAIKELKTKLEAAEARITELEG